MRYSTEPLSPTAFAARAYAAQATPVNWLGRWYKGAFDVQADELFSEFHSEVRLDCPFGTFFVRDHTLGLQGNAQPVGLVAETLIGLAFSVARAGRNSTWLNKVQGELSHLVLLQQYGYILQEVNTALDLVEDFLGKKDGPPPASGYVALAREKLRASVAYANLMVFLASDDAKQLRFARHKHIAHRGLSSSARAQGATGKSHDTAASLLQLQSLSAAVFSSDALLQSIMKLAGILAEMTAVLGLFAGFFVHTGESLYEVTVIGLPHDWPEAYPNLHWAEDAVRKHLADLYTPRRGKNFTLPTDTELWKPPQHLWTFGS